MDKAALYEKIRNSWSNPEETAYLLGLMEKDGVPANRER